MTYKINGKQYWRRNGVYCSWTEEEGRKEISAEEYMSALENRIDNPIKKEEAKVIIDSKSKVEILYQEVNKNNRIVNKKKVVTYGNLEKVISNMRAKDNFVKILATTNL